MRLATFCINVWSWLVNNITPLSIDTAANPISGTLPITLNQAYEKGKLTAGKLVLMVTAASGYAGGAAIYKVSDDLK